MTNAFWRCLDSSSTQCLHKDLESFSSVIGARQPTQDGRIFAKRMMPPAKVEDGVGNAIDLVCPPERRTDAAFCSIGSNKRNKGLVKKLSK